MTGLAIARHRLANQSIDPVGLARPAAVVKQLGAVQAQDYLASLWAVGLRLPTAVEADIEQAIADREIVRTWPMRGTLHFVAPEDVRWMLALLTPRIISRAARRRQQLELDEATLARSLALFGSALQGGGCLSRPEMMAVLERGGIATSGQRGYYILWWTAQNGLICFGPRRGKQDTFVLLDEWLPQAKTLSREEALVEVARRYFSGHGPATLQDFMWWSGLAAAEAKAGLKMAESGLVREMVAGQSFWFAPAPAAKQASATPTAHLLPSFDEYLLGYKDRGAVLDPAYAPKVGPGANGIFKPIIVIDGRVAGTWQRTRRKAKVLIRLDAFEPLSPTQFEATVAAAESYGRFLGRPVEISR
jgi:hypothetical protein